jgi:hypothetical protein
MWRHITGVEQPAKKIKLDNNEKLERKRTYVKFFFQPIYTDYAN